MSPLSMLAAAGVWPALPLTGYAFSLLLLRGTAFSSCARPTAMALMTVVGITLWSPILLGAALLGVYSGPAAGLLGWVVTALVMVSHPGLENPFSARRSAAVADGALATEKESGADASGSSRRESRASRASRGKLKRRARSHKRLPWPSGWGEPDKGWDRILAVGLTIAAVLYLGFPAQSIYGGRDEGIYAMHGTYVARHGRLDVPYPWPPEADEIFAKAWVGFPGYYNTQPSMTMQFGPLFPVWLAQAFSTLGHHGLFRLNATFALLFLGVFYGFCRLTLPKAYAVVATLFLALNPSELWISRITLSEVLTQLLLWSGLLFLLLALRDDDRSRARCAGAILGLSVLVRFDSLLVLPLLFLAHAAMRIIDEPAGKSTRIWAAFYQTAVPAFALGFAYFFVFDKQYVMTRMYLPTLTRVYLVAPAFLLASWPPVTRRLRPWLTSRELLLAVGLVVLALAVYAYWIRPYPDDPSQLRMRWPGYPANPGRDYHEDSLVNLARYLSPAVLWTAIAGWFATLWTLVRGRRSVYLLPALVAIAGFSFVYCYHHASTPDHFWTIRRWVPVVIPGFVFCAALGGKWLLERLPSGLSSGAALAVVLFLAVFTWRADSLIMNFAESDGYFEDVRRLAERLPRNEVIIAQGFPTWMTPLYVAFDRKVVSLNLNKESAKEALRRWVSKQDGEGKKSYLLVQYPRFGMPTTGSLSGLPDVRYTTLDRATLSRTFTEPTIHPLPEKIVTNQENVVLRQISRR